jgi:hypothetical protein
VLGGASVDNQNVADTTLLQTGEYGQQVRSSRDRDRSANHTVAAAVRTELAWQDAQCLVRVGETCRVELPCLCRNRAAGHRLTTPGYVVIGLPA